MSFKTLLLLSVLFCLASCCFAFDDDENGSLTASIGNYYATHNTVARPTAVKGTAVALCVRVTITTGSVIDDLGGTMSLRKRTYNWYMGTLSGWSDVGNILITKATKIGEKDLSISNDPVGYVEYQAVGQDNEGNEFETNISRTWIVGGAVSGTARWYKQTPYISYDKTIGDPEASGILPPECKLYYAPDSSCIDYMILYQQPDNSDLYTVAPGGQHYDGQINLQHKHIRFTPVGLGASPLNSWTGALNVNMRDPNTAINDEMLTIGTIQVNHTM